MNLTENRIDFISVLMWHLHNRCMFPLLKVPLIGAFEGRLGRPFGAPSIAWQGAPSALH